MDRQELSRSGSPLLASIITIQVQQHLQTTRYQTGSFGFHLDLLSGVGRRRFANYSPGGSLHNTDGHYMIVPAEYVPPKERWEQCEATLRQPTYHTMYNLPNDGNESLTGTSMQILE